MLSTTIGDRSARIIHRHQASTVGNLCLHILLSWYGLSGTRRWLSFKLLTFQNATALDYVRRDQNVSFVERSYRVYAKIDKMPVEASDSKLEPSMLGNITDSIDGSGQLDISDPYDQPDNPPTDGWLFWTQIGVPWGLGVVSAGYKLSLPKINGRWASKWQYINNPGRGVDIYVMDSGVNIHHKYFNGRALNLGGLSSVEPAPFTDNMRPVIDTENHGTL